MADFDRLNFGFGGDEEDEEEMGDGSFRFVSQRDGLIFLIDASESMFDNTDGVTSHFHKCIKCAKNVLQNKIISSDKDLLGIVFYGTENTKNPSEALMKHIFVYQDLDQPGAPRILELEDMLEASAKQFKKDYGHSGDFSLSDAFWVCSNMFSTSKHKIGYKRILLFTNNDDPHAGSVQLQRQARTKARDLAETGIDLELLQMKPTSGDFQISRFYDTILQTADDELIAAPDATEKFEELLTRVRSKDHKKRALARVPFALGEGLNFSVGVYNLVRHCNKPAAVKLYKKTNEEVKTVTKNFLEETAEVLMPQDLKFKLTYRDKDALFEKEEVDEIKRFAKPGLHLMGFKPRSSLKRYFHIKPAQFIYPDESNVEGSTTLFTALLKRCLARQQVPVCRYIPRSNATPSFAMLLPQPEEVDESGVQITPPGFHLIILPFCDDLRTLKYDTEASRAGEDQIAKAKDIIKKLSFKYRPEAFENPSLQNYYRHLEALALDRDEPEPMTDYTLPNKERIDKRAGGLIKEFKELVFPSGYEPGAKKRKAAGESAAAKKAKVEGLDMKAEAQASRLSKLTVPVLKQFIKDQGISHAGTKKNDLINAINTFYGID